MTGYITKGIGGFYYVKTDKGIVECRAKGIFRKKRITPLAGDAVVLEQEAGSSVIAEILPRKNSFIRPPVANLDVLFLVASTTQPVPSTLVLDKMAALAVYKKAEPVIVCTKTDLAASDRLEEAYHLSGIPLIKIDYESGEGIDEVKRRIEGKLCAFCGNSGVGKSTLLNHILPEAVRETAAISQKLGRGRIPPERWRSLRSAGEGWRIRRALPVWRLTACVISPRRSLTRRFRRWSLTVFNAVLPAVPTVRKQAARCVRPLRKAGFPIRGTRAILPFTIR